MLTDSDIAEIRRLIDGEPDDSAVLVPVGDLRQMLDALVAQRAETDSDER